MTFVQYTIGLYKVIRTHILYQEWFCFFFACAFFSSVVVMLGNMISCGFSAAAALSFFGGGLLLPPPPPPPTSHHHRERNGIFNYVTKRNFTLRKDESSCHLQLDSEELVQTKQSTTIETIEEDEKSCVCSSYSTTSAARDETSERELRFG